MTYDPRYTGCPGCRAWEDVDCTCTGADYQGGFVEILRSRWERVCTCGAAPGQTHEAGCPLCEYQVIMLTRPFDFAVWGDRRLLRYQDD